MCQTETLQFENIQFKEENDITIINVIDRDSTIAALLHNGGERNMFAGALLTSGSFTMMASSAF